ncbi:MAG: flagellar biosynthetic protein FliR [Desulfovibrionaceae bacterium]|jgi:flagellar biosynthetic protein FliR|nr:flagellar biosynthetic protein FliR [Desulfovibrionaceae bacterium]
MGIFPIDPGNILSFFLTLFRISLIVFLLPFFGGDTVPRMVKAALCLVLALALFPRLSFPGALFPEHIFSIALVIVGELLLGLVLGLVVRIIFAAVQTGGQIVGFQMGFAMVNVVDPMTGTSEAVTAHFLYMVTLLTFLVLNGHLVMLSGLADSFRLIPPGGLLLTPHLTDQVLTFSAQIFILGAKIAAPIIACLFLVDLALALVARAAPQMNVLLIGFPLKISVGMFFLGLVFATMSLYMRQFTVELPELYHSILSAGSPLVP